MADINVKVRKWGDSLAVIIPKDIAKQEKISTNDSIRIKLEKKMNFLDLFGIAKGKIKKSAQQLKNESRQGWK